MKSNYWTKHTLKYLLQQMNDIVKHELRVTSYELPVTSQNLKRTSWKLKRTSWNSKVRVQIHELRVQIYELRVQIYPAGMDASQIHLWDVPYSVSKTSQRGLICKSLTRLAGDWLKTSPQRRLWDFSSFLRDLFELHLRD